MALTSQVGYRKIRHQVTIEIANGNPHAAARAVLAEPSLGPAQALEIYDPLVAKIETVLEHRRALVETRTLMLYYAADQITKLPSRQATG